MNVEIRIPEVGESITEGVLVGWMKKSGEPVSPGEVLFELETDKITLSIPAEVKGLLSILVPEGTLVKVGQVVGQIETQDSVAPEPLRGPSQLEESLAWLTPKSPEKREPQPVGEGPPISSPAGLAQAQDKLGSVAGPQPPLSPAVRRMVEEHRLDPAQIPGSGKNGRLTKGDVITHLSAPALPTPQSAPPQPAHKPSPGQTDGRETRVPMSPLRHRIAERLVLAQQTAAILTTFNEADMSSLMAFRAKHKDKFEKKFDVRLGFMSFFVKAVVDGLRTVPQLNARIDGDTIVYQHYYDIGVAVGTDAGLVVPVIRDAEQQNFGQLEKKIADFAERARTRRLTLPDLTGGCFTISNGGVYGSLLSTPIINPPQSGILGMHRIQKRAVVVSDQIVIRPMMYLALSYDHRLIDGSEAVTFLKRVVECIEDPERMLLEV